MQNNQFLNFLDMINGGGAGQAGDKFEGGGLLSLLGNALGIKPQGYRERQAQAAVPMATPPAAPAVSTRQRPQARPTGLGLPMTGMDETLLEPPPPPPSYGMPPEQGPFFRDPRSMPSTGMDEALAGSGMAPARQIGQVNPNAIADGFGSWLEETYGPEQARMLTPEMLRVQLQKWMQTRPNMGF